MKKIILLWSVLLIGTPLFAQQLNKAEPQKKQAPQPVRATPQQSAVKDKTGATKERPVQSPQSGAPAVAPLQPASKEKPANKEHGKEQAEHAPKVKKDGTPDKRFKENQKRRKDGKPDKRFKENKEKSEGSEKKPAGK